MAKPETIKIDDVEYIRKDSLPDPSGAIAIVVLDRGFVYIGRIDDSPEEGFLVLRNAKNIRVWGTTQGLGELVNGPTKTTKLDLVGTVRIPMRAVISVIDVVESKWSSI